MVEIITGLAGTGKTKMLIDKCNEAIKSTDGSIIFIDKSMKHMYDLDSKIRLINICEYPVSTSGEFLGFLSGVISQNTSIKEIYLDSILKLGFIDTNNGLIEAIDKLEKISECFDVRFIVCVSKAKDDLPEEIADKVISAL